MNIAETNASALALARTRKMKNALTALFCGALPAAVLGTLFHTSPLHWLVGFAVGLIWANAFEYFYHRYLLHLPGHYLGKLHQLHHASVGTPLEIEHLNLGGTPPLVLAAFVLNGLVVTFLADVLLKLRISRESLLLSRCTSSPSKRFIGAFTSVDGFLRGCTLCANII